MLFGGAEPYRVDYQLTTGDTAFACVNGPEDAGSAGTLPFRSNQTAATDHDF